MRHWAHLPTFFPASNGRRRRRQKDGPLRTNLILPPIPPSAFTWRRQRQLSQCAAARLLPPSRLRASTQVTWLFVRPRDPPLRRLGARAPPLFSSDDSRQQTSVRDQPPSRVDRRRDALPSPPPALPPCAFKLLPPRSISQPPRRSPSQRQSQSDTGASSTRLGSSC